MKTTMIIFMTKVIAYILEKLGKGGSFPGILALKLDPNILQKIRYPKDVILLTGTNGKTTTTNMMFDVLVKSNYKVISNLKGDNLKVGVATALLKSCSLQGKIQGDIVLLEVDELSIPKVMKDVKATHFLVNNFFRDQLDRAGEMETVIRKIEGALTDFTGTLYLNGDDPNVARLARFGHEVRYFGVGENDHSQKSNNESSEGKFCIVCGQALDYDFYQYSHIGHFACQCGEFGPFVYDTYISSINFNEANFTVEDVIYPVKLNALYYYYNCVAILALSKSFEIDNNVHKDVFLNFDRMNGRNEEYTMRNGNTLVLNLVKNPTGTNEVLKTIAQDEREKVVMMILNDNDQDGKDISWIWDAHFERLSNEKIKRVYCSGRRAYDMALRLKYSELEISFIVEEEIDLCLAKMLEEDTMYYVISTYTALQKVRAIIKE